MTNRFYLVSSAAVVAVFLSACGGGNEITREPDVEEAVDPVAFVDSGATLFRTHGCGGCHGAPDGMFEPGNPDAPRFAEVVATLGLEDREEKDGAILHLAAGTLDSELGGSSDPDTQAFVAAVDAIRTRIAGDTHDAVVDRDEMPAWGDVLSDEDIDALIAFLIDRTP